MTPWFFEDPKEFALWKKLNSLSLEERKRPKWKEIVRDVTERYGNIYFYKPFPKQKEVHEDTNRYIFIHGDNSSGKSYCACAEVAYEVMGWSPYKEIKKPKYGHRLIWVFTPSFSIQKASSQNLLFSTDSAVDVGLLPRLEVIRQAGGKIFWQKQEDSALESVLFPDGTKIEFKSSEQRSLTVSAAGVDLVYSDELIPKPHYNECIARIIRKDGRFLMSFILEDTEDNYVVQDLYQRYLEDIAKTGKSSRSFYFLSIEDNLSLDPKTIEEKKSQVTEDERVWRFGGGQFVVKSEHMRVYESFSEKVHTADDLVSKYDPMRTIWRSWDLGRIHPVCISGQIDKFGRLRVYFSHMGTRVQLPDFIDEVRALSKELFPRANFYFEILPHDAKRGSDLTATFITAENIFHEKGLSTEVIYVSKERSIDMVNEKFNVVRKGEPLILLDSKHTRPLISCLSNYTRDKRGKLKEDGFYEHLSDAFKLLISFLYSHLGDDTFKEETPAYFSSAL